MRRGLKFLIISIFSIVMLCGCGNKFLGTQANKEESEISSEITVWKEVNNFKEADRTLNDDNYLTEKNEAIEEDTEETEEVDLITINSEDVRIPILMYHSISDENPENNLMVPPAMFEEQMAWLEENGFTAMDLDQAVEAMETGVVPEKPVVITFDDGYMDNYTSAFPILKKHNLKATFFVITDGVDDGYYMSSDMLKEMQSEGMVIENHTANHLELNSLSREDAYDSIKRGQDYLRDTIGASGNYLCYPVGRYSDETIEICKELGIKASVTTEAGISSSADGIYQLKRIRISPMDISSFASIFSE